MTGEFQLQVMPVSKVPGTKRRFCIEPLEARIAPEALLDLNLDVLISDVTVDLRDINAVVAGNVIQVGLLFTGPMSGTVHSLVVVT